MIRNAKASDVVSIVRIHYDELNADFLSSLGEKFLQQLYFSLIKNKNIYVYVYESNKEIQGFVAGSKDFSNTFKKIIINNFARYSLSIFPQLLQKPYLIKKIIETLFYTKQGGSIAPSAELIALSVMKKCQRQGIGKKLVNVLEKKFRKGNIKNYKVSVNANYLGANNFYKSLGFKYSHSFNIYGKILNSYFRETDIK